MFSQESTSIITIKNYEEIARKAILEDILMENDSKKMKEVYTFVSLNSVEPKNKETQALLKIFEGSFDLDKRSYKSAEELFFEAYAIFEELDNNLYKAYTQNLIAITYGVKGENVSAVELYIKAINYFDNTDYNSFKMLINFNITGPLIRLGRYDEGLKFGLKSYQVAEEHTIINSSLKYLYFNIATCYVEKNEFENAEIFIKKAEPLLDKHHKIAKSKLYKNYVNIYEKQNLIEKVNIYKDSLINIFQEAYMLSLQSTNDALYDNKKLNEAVETINRDIISKKQQFLYLLLAFVGMFFLLSLYLVSLIKELRNSKLIMKALLRENERNLMSKLYNITTKNEFLNLTVHKLENIIRSEDEMKKSSVLSIIKDIERNTNKNEVWDEFQIHFEKTNPDFFKRLRSVNDSVTAKDLKLSAYILANMDTKEIASLIGISVRSVETSKYRLKKKLNIDKDKSLFNFLNSV